MKTLPLSHATVFSISFFPLPRQAGLSAAGGTASSEGSARDRRLRAESDDRLAEGGTAAADGAIVGLRGSLAAQRERQAAELLVLRDQVKEHLGMALMTDGLMLRAWSINWHIDLEQSYLPME